MVKTYHSLDFASAKKRIEKTVIDPYDVHLEDYENINDLIARSIRTKTEFKPEHVSGVEYDLITDDETGETSLTEESSFATITEGPKKEELALERSESKSSSNFGPDVKEQKED